MATSKATKHLEKAKKDMLEMKRLKKKRDYEKAKPKDINVIARAQEIARAEVLKVCAEIGLTPSKVLQGIVDGLGATEQKIAYNANMQEFDYSDEVIAWPARQKAIDQSMAILDLKAAEKSNVNLNSAATTLVLSFTGDKE